MRKLLIAGVLGLLSLLVLAAPASAREFRSYSHSYGRPYQGRPYARVAPTYVAPRYYGYGAPYVSPYSYPYYARGYSAPRVYRPWHFRGYRRW